MNERKIPGGLKDERGVYVPNYRVIEESVPTKPYAEPMRHEIDIDDLLTRCLITLWREVYNLQEASSGGKKLTEEQAKELRENTKLLMDLKKKEKELLDGLSDEELAELSRVKNGSAKGTRKTRKAKPTAESV